MVKRGDPSVLRAVMSPSGDGQSDFDIHDDFATRLRDTASAIGLNAARLAALTGVRRGTMARYWHGERTVPADLLFKLADLLGVDARWLFAGTVVPGMPVPNISVSDGERRLIDAIRRLLPADRARLLNAIGLDPESPDPPTTLPIAGPPR
jgi:transcriptional regulator with XRE-family HTH domain